jgi:RHH-type transcriptional regulator, rel operon repressor / antitoxin RelB
MHMGKRSESRMSEEATITLQLKKETKAKLEALARSTQRDEGVLVAEAIDAYVELEGWQLEEIRKAVEQADAGGPFYAHEDVMDYLESRARGEKPPRPKPIGIP